MRSEVFNNSIGSTYPFNYPKLTFEQEQEIIAGLFEQLLIFDHITISTSRLNFAVVFLISRLGINTVERLLDSGYIKFMIWTPVILTSSGREREDKSIDESVIYGQPPIMAGSFSDDDKDPEKNIQNALVNFRDLPRERKRIFTQKALKHYIVPNGMEFSGDSAKLIIDAYKNNNLQELGLPYEREPQQLHFKERTLLLELGHKVLETAVLSNYNLKSYENFEHYSICKQNLHNIGKAYNIADNSDIIFNLEGLPNLKQLFLQEHMGFESVFKIRHLSSAKFYRKWVNEIGENATANEITKEYFNEIKGNNRFFESTKGKFVKNLLMYGANSALGAAIAGPAGLVAGYTLGLLETFVLDNLLKGKNPSMFIEDIKRETNNQK